MKLSVRKSAWHEAGVNYTQTELATQVCCEEMGSAWDGDFIGYGDREDGDAKGDRNINIYKFDTEEEIWLALPISYCPFCGTSVEVQHAS